VTTRTTTTINSSLIMSVVVCTSWYCDYTDYTVVC